MKALRKESRAALQHIIDHGPTTCDAYAQESGCPTENIGEIFRLLMRKGILSREREKHSFVYSVADMDMAKEIASKTPKKEAAQAAYRAMVKDQSWEKESAEIAKSLPRYPLPCSFVFNLGATA